MATKRSASLNRYLNNQSDVANARASLAADLKLYNQAKFYFENLSPTSKDFSAALDNWNLAKARAESLQQAVRDAEAAATTRFQQEEEQKAKTKKTQETSDIEAKLNPLYVQRNAYTRQNAPVPEAITAAIKNLETQLRAKGGRPTPGITGPVGPDQPAGGAGATNVTGGTGTPTPVQSALTEDLVTFTQKYMGNVEKTKELQQALKDANLYKGPVNGRFDAVKIDAALKEAEIKIGTYESYGITFPNRIEALKRIASDFRSGGGVGGAGGISLTISNPTQADAYVNAAFKSELGRDATAAELQKYRKILNTAEEKNPTKTVNGRTVGGLNREQFLKAELQKLPEFAKKKTDKAAITSQSILGTARANGITLNQNEIDNFTKQVQDGTDIKVIQNQIRSIAANGMPDNVKKLLNEGVDLDTVYAPYKNLMASVLELNPESIDLKDPTLRLAFGPDKETTIYDFEKALRKDYRWQYTDNAKRDVSNVALKVLRDFGFQA